jgi:uncharacterized membrane protein YbhN (UPF0104 family)
MSALKNNPTKQSKTWNILKIALAVSLAGLILSQTSISQLAGLWQRVSIPWLLLAIVAFSTIAWSTARRYWMLIGRKTTFRQLLALVILQTVIGNLFATSAGAASYVAILRTRYQVQVSRGITSLLLSRFSDLLIVILALGLSSIALWSQIATLHWLIVPLMAGLIIFAVVIFLVFVFRQPLVGAINQLLSRLHLNRIAFLNRNFETLAMFAKRDPGRFRILLGPIAVYSCLTLVLMFAFFYSSLRLFAVTVDVWSIIFIVSLTQLMALVPIQVFGGLGVADITNMYLLSLFGISQSELIPVIIGLRVIFYVVNLFLLLYLPLLNIRLKRESNATLTGNSCP